eukprot:Clim_evm6s97 gene=Clim_evmTU6s97
MLKFRKLSWSRDVRQGAQDGQQQNTDGGQHDAELVPDIMENKDQDSTVEENIELTEQRTLDDKSGKSSPELRLIGASDTDNDLGPKRDSGDWEISTEDAQTSGGISIQRVPTAGHRPKPLERHASANAAEDPGQVIIPGQGPSRLGPKSSLTQSAPAGVTGSGSGTAMHRTNTSSSSISKMAETIRQMDTGWDRNDAAMAFLSKLTLRGMVREAGGDIDTAMGGAAGIGSDGRTASPRVDEKAADVAVPMEDDKRAADDALALARDTSLSSQEGPGVAAGAAIAAVASSEEASGAELDADQRPKSTATPFDHPQLLRRHLRTRRKHLHGATIMMHTFRNKGDGFNAVKLKNNGAIDQASATGQAGVSASEAVMRADVGAESGDAPIKMATGFGVPVALFSIVASSYGGGRNRGADARQTPAKRRTTVDDYDGDYPQSERHARAYGTATKSPKLRPAPSGTIDVDSEYEPYHSGGIPTNIRSQSLLSLGAPATQGPSGSTIIPVGAAGDDGELGTLAKTPGGAQVIVEGTTYIVDSSSIIPTGLPSGPTEKSYKNLLGPLRIATAADCASGVGGGAGSLTGTEGGGVVSQTPLSVSEARVTPRLTPVSAAILDLDGGGALLPSSMTAATTTPISAAGKQHRRRSSEHRISASDEAGARGAKLAGDEVITSQLEHAMADDHTDDEESSESPLHTTPGREPTQQQQQQTVIVDPAMNEEPTMPLLDDPELGAGKHRIVLTLPSYNVSILQYVKASELKRDLNEQFKERYPQILITFSKMRSLKRVMLECALQAQLEMSTVGLAYTYFERLVLQQQVVKRNRKPVAAGCLLLAAKFSDPKCNHLDSLLEIMDKEFNIEKESILWHEFDIFAALDFDLRAAVGDYMPRLNRLLADLEYSEPLYTMLENGTL